MEKDLWYRIDNISTGRISGMELGSNLYRLAESSVISEEYVYGMKVQASLKEDNKIWIDKIIEESVFVTEGFTIKDEFYKSDEFKELAKKIISWGGDWENLFGGMIYFHIPKTSIDSFKEALSSAKRRFFSR